VIAAVMDFLARHSFFVMVMIFLLFVIVVVSHENNPRNHW
jgi:hypothetical protein